MTWQPAAPRSSLEARARLNRLIRDFFERRTVLEVETPLLCSTTATDLHLRSFAVPVDHQTRFLQTSPEFTMKRLLAAGSGAIYQLGKAFRHEAAGRYHNPEFTLLEWYRPQWTLEQLVNEVEELVLEAAELFGIDLQPFPRTTYQAAFEQALDLNPHTASEAQLRETANSRISGDFSTLERNGLLDLLMSHLVEPTLPDNGIFLSGFPASQAALSRVEADADGILLSRRTELYIKGIELANAYQELTVAESQEERFRKDIDQRMQSDDPTQPSLPYPAQLVDALRHGFPECAGVALGVDRLLMILTGATRLDELICFPWDIS